MIETGLTKREWFMGQKGYSWDSITLICKDNGIDPDAPAFPLPVKDECIAEDTESRTSVKPTNTFLGVAYCEKCGVYHEPCPNTTEEPTL